MYWIKAALVTAFISFVLRIGGFFWGVFAWAFEGLAPVAVGLFYLANWPSLLTGTFPWSYGRTGERHVSERALFDMPSILVNAAGWVVVGLLIAWAWKWFWKKKLG